MAPPLKRRKYDNYSSKYNIKNPEDDLISSSPPQLRGSKSSSLIKDPGRKKLRTRSTRSQSPVKNSNTISNSEDTSGRKIGGNTIFGSSLLSNEKTKCKVKTHEKNQNENSSASIKIQARGNKISSAPNILPVESEINSHLSNTRLPIEVDDLISDFDEDDLEFSLPPCSFLHLTAKNRSSLSRSERHTNGSIEVSAGRNKFIHQSTLSLDLTNDNKLLPWTERFSPSSLKELAVHKRKVSDVKTWLEDVMNGKIRQRILLLKGAPGSGKTTTVKLLAESFNCQLLEWQNPVGPVNSSDGILSMSAQFEEFLQRGGRFRQLESLSSNEIIPKKVIGQSDQRRSIILIEEFPNTFASPSALRCFQSSVMQYLISNTPSTLTSHSNLSLNSIVPVVMVVSETFSTSTTSDSLTVHRLLGPAILQHPGVKVIEFNPIAPTFLAKALELVVQKEARKSGRKKTPGPSVLKKLGEFGDIRSAIGSLEFLCLRGDTDGDWGAKVSFSNSKSRARDVAMTRMEKESLELITQREASLGIFHAVGKVIYNRRQDSPSNLPVAQNPEYLPNFLSINSRPKASLVSVNELIDETGTDTQTFIAALHENYLLSCNASPFCFEFSSLDHVNGCIDALSDCDLVCSSFYDSSHSTRGRDLIQRDEISFQIAVRGLLFSLPHPVTRKAPAVNGLRKGKAGEAHSMFYPTSLRLWRMREEIESNIDLWATTHLKSEQKIATPLPTGCSDDTKPKFGTVETWNSTQIQSSDATLSPKILISTGTSARREMILERLPFIAKIAKSKKNQYSQIAIKQLEKVTKFVGIGLNEDVPVEDHEIEQECDNWAPEEPDSNTSNKRAKVLAEHGNTSGFPKKQPEQKLILSDDDIEDD